MSTVGLIGLGAMGSGMAQSLRRAGHKVQVFDVRREVAAAFAKEGGVAHDTLASLGAACDVVVSVVVLMAGAPRLHALHDGGDAHAPADAEGDDAGGQIAILEAVEEREKVSLAERPHRLAALLAVC